MEHDCKIVGGTIVDGTGKARYRADVGINSGKITAIGNNLGPAQQVIDAGGLVVAPGVVDVHTHYDAQLLWDRTASISPWHGVTTIVIGNCGFGIAPCKRADRELIIQTLEIVEGMSAHALRSGLGAEWGFETFSDYTRLIQSRGMSVNVAMLVGHTPVRINVMRESAFDREATPAEIDAMKLLVKEALDAGAVGFSTSGSGSHVGYKGKPVPSRRSSFAEVQALTNVLGDAGRGVIQVNQGSSLFYEEFEAIHASSRRPLTWVALLAGYWGPGSHTKHLDQLAAYREKGIPIVPQVACRPIMIEFTFADPAPFITRKFFKPVAETDAGGRAKIYADPAFRESFRSEYGPATVRQLSGWADRAVIAEYPGRPDLNETPLIEVARARGVDPVDAALDIALQTNLAARFRIALNNYKENEVREILQAPGALIALSDAGAHASQLCDACYSTHLLGHWVRENQTMTLEEAVRRLTSEPADFIGFADRGRLVEGKAADIMIFDPHTVGASSLRRVSDMPGGESRLVSDALGMYAVMVNGCVIRKEGQDLVAQDGPLPGRFLTN